MRKPLLNRSINVIASAHSVIANDNATNVIANPEGVKQPLAAAPAKSSWSRKAIGSIAALLVAFLAACGDDSSSGKSEEDSSGIATVATYEDLIHCTKSHYGEIAYVEEENTYFECTSDDWTEVDSAKVDSILTASSSSVAADSSKPKSSSSLKVSEKDTAAVEVKKVDSVSVKGFAHKGPFAKGSSVAVYGLDSLFKKTKTKFTGSVENDSGAFKVSKVALPSQYALIEVSGYYQNEISGKKTSGSKTTLSALVDLSAGKSVTANVNLFTDMEYARARHLILNEKFNVTAAKKRATKELLAVFGASSKDKESDDLTATSLSLFDTTKAGKTLFFASLLMQGDLSASKFGTFLGVSEELFAATGALDSAELRVAIADWASKVDSTDNFAQIRENVKNLKLMATVPDFESALYAFWTKEYGLGSCTDELESTIKKNENKLSDNYGAGYACTAKRWHKATALDTELDLCTGKMEGQFKERKGKKDTEYYVCKAGSWKEISETQYELKECTEERNNKYETTKSGEYFVCSDKQWIEIDDVTYELHLCTESRKYELAATKKLGSYVCRFDGKESEWEKATDVETELGVCGGKGVKADSIYKTKENEYYLCKAASWSESDQAAFELQPAGACTEENNLTTFETKNLGLYVCEDNDWRKATDLESDIGVCGSKSVKIDSIYKAKDDKYYQCVSDKWVDAEKLAYELQKAGACTEENNLTSFETENMGLYVCENKAWREATDLESELGVCGGKDVKADGIYKTESGSCYQCSAGKWEVSTQLLYELQNAGACTEDKNLTTFETENLGLYVCENKAWREATELEVALGVCGTVDNPNETRKEKSGKYYLCYEKWREITALEYEIGACGGDGGIAQDSFVEKKADEHYYCDGKSWATIDSVTYALEKFCTESAGESLDSLEQCSNESCSQTSKVIYGCSSYNDEWKWVRTSYPYRKICSDLHEGDFIEVSSQSHYYCQKKDETFSWLSVTQGAYMLKRLCDAEHNLDTVTCKTEECNGKKYYCFNYVAYHNIRGTYRTLLNNSNLSHYGWYDSLADYEVGIGGSYEKIATYAITRIGSQLWMAENLRYRYTTGTAPDSGSYCRNNKVDNCKEFGRLYLWDAAMDKASTREKYPLYDSEVRGICPIGWHIPSVGDFEKMLKAIGLTQSSDTWTGAASLLKEYGFSALPLAGYGWIEEGVIRYSNPPQNYTYFWSSTSYSDKNGKYAYDFQLGSSTSMYKNQSGLESLPPAYSVRCVKDDD